jgi:DNA-binding NtrC family response regulator
MTQSKSTLIVIDDEQGICDQLRILLSTQCLCKVLTFNDGRKAYPSFALEKVAAVFLDWIMPYPGEEVLKYITSHHPEVQVFIMTALNDTQTAVHAMKLGASNYMTKPLDTVRLVADAKIAIRLFEANKTARHLSSTLLKGASDNNHGMLYKSDAMARTMLYVEGISESRQPVLITGETGTGKEGLARAIHKTSGVAGKFVAVNIAGLDNHIISDALFGHKKGAFTGADSHTEGLIAKAENGTLFLDEIGDLVEENQVKLLRLLQENEYYKLGSSALMKCNIRIIAATNKNFSDKKIANTIRKDLFYRLSVHSCTIPPLRERTEDIALLASYFAAETARNLNKAVPKFTVEALALLESYSYPGNVRELKNIIKDICTRITNGEISINDFPPHIPRLHFKPAEMSQLDNHPLTSIFSKFPTLDEIETYAIHEVMKITNNNQSAAARILNISRPTLNKRLKTMGK